MKTILILMSLLSTSAFAFGTLDLECKTKIPGQDEEVSVRIFAEEDFCSGKLSNPIYVLYNQYGYDVIIPGMKTYRDGGTSYNFTQRTGRFKELNMNFWIDFQYGGGDGAENRKAKGTFTSYNPTKSKKITLTCNAEPIVVDCEGR